MKTYEIFWTGGFDSTFRVVQLSRLPIRIQPVFCTGVATDIRKSQFYELRAIKRITELLRQKPETKAEILPLKIVHTSSNPPEKKDPDFVYEVLPKNHAVATAFRKIYISMMAPRRDQLASNRGVLNAVNLDLYIDSQYQWLAAYANSRKEPVEVGITARYVKKFMDAIGGGDAIEEIDNGDFKQYVLNKDKCLSSDGYEVFGNFAYSFYNAPLKPQLVEEYKKMGCEDVMNLTWFCYDPIDDEPCGQCWTCVHTYRDGITNRFSPAALERYHRREKELQASDNSQDKNI